MSDRDNARRHVEILSALGRRASPELEARAYPSRGERRRRRRPQQFEQTQFEPIQYEPLPRMVRNATPLPTPPQGTRTPMSDGRGGFYGYQYEPAGMTANLAFQDRLVEALRQEPVEFRPQFDIDGRPIMSTAQVQQYLGAREMGDYQEMTNRYGIVSPVMVDQRFPTPEAAAAARAGSTRPTRPPARPRRPGNPVPEPSSPMFDRAPDNMSMNEFREWLGRESQWQDIPF